MFARSPLDSCGSLRVQFVGISHDEVWEAQHGFITIMEIGVCCQLPSQLPGTCDHSELGLSSAVIFMCITFVHFICDFTAGFI